MQAVRRVPPPSRWLAVAGHVRVSPPPSAALECLRRRRPRSSVSAAAGRARASPPPLVPRRHRVTAAERSPRSSRPATPTVFHLRVSSVSIVCSSRVAPSRRAISFVPYREYETAVTVARHSATGSDRFMRPHIWCPGIV